ncbi:MAG: response regulator transcription factor [Brevinematales bacterium]|nr:response regulator transcription factor [Brevinematales bacterium]
MREMVWIVEDEPDIRELEKTALEESGFLCLGFPTAYDFMRAFQATNQKPQVIVLDIMLPDRSGLDLIRWIREKNPSIGILCVSARGDEMDRVIGLDLGADDYLPKPFSPREMVSRVRAILRRHSAPPAPSSLLQWEGICLDTSRFHVTVDGEEVSLTATEFRLLAILVENPGQVFSRENLIERLWNNEKAIMDRTIDVHIKHLREKLKNYGSCLQTLRGIGYKLDNPQRPR